MARRTVQSSSAPQLLVLATVPSAIFLGSFRHIFGGAITVEACPLSTSSCPGSSPQPSCTPAGRGGRGGRGPPAGRFDRLCSLPIPRASVMAGRGLADTALVTWRLAVGAALGLAVGDRLAGSVAAGLAAFGLCVLFSSAFAWLFITIGLVAGNAQATQGPPCW